VRGVVLLLGEKSGLEIGEFSPRLIKQTVVGYGNAEKHQVQEMVRLLLRMKTVPEPHDAADALAIAILSFSSRRRAKPNHKKSFAAIFLFHRRRFAKNSEILIFIE
jgi:crossover junction endodeoxyribonuclease RuvC